MTIVDAAEPPLRTPFGGDTVQRIEAKNAFVAEELARWRAIWPVQPTSLLRDAQDFKLNERN